MRVNKDYNGGFAGALAGEAGTAGAGGGAAAFAAGNTLNSVHLITKRTGTVTSFKCSISSDRW